MKIKFGIPGRKCPACKQGRVFYFPGPDPGQPYGMACDNPYCNWIDSTDHEAYAHGWDMPDTRRRELAT